MIRAHRPLIGAAGLALILAGAAAAVVPAPAAKIKIEVQPTVLFVEEGGALKQRIDLAVDYDGPAAPAKVTIQGFRKTIALTVDSLTPGKSVVPVLIPDLLQPARITFQVAAGKAEASREVMLAPPAQVDALSSAPFAFRYRIHRAADARHQKPRRVSRRGPGFLQSHGRIPGRGQVPLEYRGVLELAELSQDPARGQGRGADCPAQVRAGGAVGLVSESIRRIFA